MKSFWKSLSVMLTSLICIRICVDLFGLSNNCKVFDVWKLKISQIYSSAFAGGKSQFWSQSFAVYCDPLLIHPWKAGDVSWNLVQEPPVSVTLHEKWKRATLMKCIFECQIMWSCVMPECSFEICSVLSYRHVCTYLHKCTSLTQLTKEQMFV